MAAISSLNQSSQRTQKSVPQPAMKDKKSETINNKEHKTTNEKEWKAKSKIDLAIMSKRTCKTIYKK